MTATPTQTATITQTNTPISTPTQTGTPTPSVTGTHPPTRTSTRTPSNTLTVTATQTPTAVATRTATASYTAPPSSTSTGTPTPTATVTPTPTVPFTLTRTATLTPTSTGTPRATATASPSATRTPTLTPYPGDFGLAPKVVPETPGPVTAGHFGAAPTPGHPATMDVAIGGATAPEVQLLQNDGQGNLTPLPALTLSGAAGGIGALTAADLNGDGHLDLVASNPATNQIVVLLGDGNEQFTEGAHATLSSAPGRLAIQEVTGNGTADVVVTDQTGVAVFEGMGGGNLMLSRHVDIGAPPSDLVVTDVTRDGTPDLIVAVPSQSQVQIYAGDGHGGFTLSATPPIADPQALVVGDLNADGVPDLVVADAADQSLAVFFGIRAGGFAASPSIINGVAATQLVRADVNGDGRADLVALINPPSGVPMLDTLLGNGDGTFQLAPPLPVQGAVGLVVADLNGDRLPDIVVSVPTASTVVVATNLSPLALVPGDADGDRVVTAADVEQTAAELFDGSDALNVAGGEVPSTAGVDANGDGRITAADIVGALRRLGTAK